MSELPSERARRIWIAAALLVLAALAAWLLLHKPPHSPIPPRAKPTQEAAAPSAPLADAQAESTPRPERIPEQTSVPPEPPISLSMTGRVLDAMTDAPIAGARIELLRGVYSSAGNRFEPVTETTTAADGTYEFPPMPSRAYHILARADGYAREDLRAEVPERLAQRDGELPRLSIRDIRLMHGFRGRFTVVDATTKAPLPHAPVYLLEGNLSLDGKLACFLGETDEHGDCAPSEPIAIEGEATWALALGPDGLGMLALASGDRFASERSFTLAVERGGDFLVDVVDGAGKPVEGALVHASTYAVPLGPVSRMWAMFDLSGGSGDGGRLDARFAALTDASGRAGLHGLPTVDSRLGYHLGASKKDRGGASVEKQQPALEPRVLHLALKQEEPLTRITGTVRTDDGSPLPAVTVSHGGRSVRADPSTGHYELSDFQPSGIEGFFIKARAPGWSNGREYPRGAVHDITIFRSGNIRGVVLDGEGRPFANAAVTYHKAESGDTRARGSDPAVPVATLSDGVFAIPDIPLGSYELRVDVRDPFELSFAGAREALWFPPIIAECGDTAVRIQGRPNSATQGRVHARVVDFDTSAPVDISKASLEPPSRIGGGFIPRTTTFRYRLGEIEIPNVSVGQWRLWVAASDGACGYVDFETTESAPDADVRLRLGSVRLTGRLIAAPGVDAPGSWSDCHVVVNRKRDGSEPPGWDDRVPTNARAVVHADGSFEFPALPQGQYVLQANQGSLHAALDVDAPDCGSKSLEVALRVFALALIQVDGPPDLFDGLTILRWTDGQQEPEDFPLKPDKPLGSRWTFRLETGKYRVQAWRRADASDKSEPKSFFFDESFELKADETRALVLPRPP